MMMTICTRVVSQIPAARPICKGVAGIAIALIRYDRGTDEIGARVHVAGSRGGGGCAVAFAPEFSESGSDGRDIETGAVGLRAES